MDISKFVHFIDFITKEEMKCFDTEKISFSHVEISKDYNDMHSNLFYFKTQNDFLIEFFISVRMFETNRIRIGFDINAVTIVKYYLLSEEELVPYKKDVEPILIFLERKREEIEENIKKDHSLRLFCLLDEEKIQVQNVALEKYNRLKNEAERHGCF